MLWPAAEVDCEKFKSQRLVGGVGGWKQDLLPSRWMDLDFKKELETDVRFNLTAH